MVTTKVANYVTIKNNSNEVALDKNTEMNFEGTGRIITKKHVPIFQVLRAKDGDNTTFSRKDLRKAYKDEAILESFGYKLEKTDRNNYTLTSNEGEEISFKFESLKEKISRKWTEFKEERAEIRAAKKAEKAAKKEKKDLERAEKYLPYTQKRNADYFDITLDKENAKYDISMKKDLSVATIASEVGVSDLAVAKAFAEELELSAATDPESGLYDKNVAETLEEVKATIRNHEEGSAKDSDYSDFSRYQVPSWMTLSVGIND